MKPSTSLRQWGPLVPILILALLMRIGYMPVVGFSIDMQFFSQWALRVYQGGLFNLYKDAPPDYPPLYMAALGVVAAAEVPRSTNFDTDANSELVALLKVFPVLADLALIAVVYVWLRREGALRWLLPGLLAVYPGLFALSSSWGQTDSLLTLLLVLTLIALIRDRPLVAFALFAIAIVTKFQAVVLFPLLVTLTFRRYGIRKLLLGAAINAIIIVVVLAPFVAASGLQNTLRPYLGTVDTYPLVTISAYNPWLLVTQLAHTDRYFDNVAALGPLTYKHIGLALLGAYTLLICYAAFRQAQQRREFIWAAALYFGFFMLPTQIHERYVCMAAILALIAVAQDRRVWWVAAGLALTFSFNVLNVLDQPLHWLGLVIWPRTTVAPIAVLNCALLIELTVLAILPSFSVASRARRLLLKTNRVIAVLAMLAFVVGVTIESITYHGTVAWLEQHVAGWEHLVSDSTAAEVVAQSNADRSAEPWTWHVERMVEKKDVGAWLGDGNHYLLVDERADRSQPFEQRLQRLIDQGASLLYQTDNAMGIGARQAVLWTFHPTYPVHLTFDGSLELIGYQQFATASGHPGVLFLWYNRRPTTAIYNVFIHALDAAGAESAAQADAPVGKLVHPTNTWRPNELVFDIVELPDTILNTSQTPVQLRVGLYQVSTGTRAAITDESGKPVGDSIVINVP